MNGHGFAVDSAQRREASWKSTVDIIGKGKEQGV